MGVPGAGGDDGGGPALAAEARLNVTLGRLTEVVNRLATPPAADPYAVVRFVPFTQQVVLSAAGAGLVDLGGPTAGYMWMVRRVSISDSQSARASMGAAIGDFYTAIAQEVTATVRPQLWSWSFASLPNLATFGDSDFPVQYGEHLTGVIAGGTPGQQVQVSGLLQLYSVASQMPAVDVI